MTTPYIQDQELNILLTQPGTVVVDFTATWCGPCRLIAPLIDRLYEEYVDKAQVFKIDLDQNKENADKYNIRSIPAVLVFKDGELTERIVGKADYDTFSQAVNKNI